MGTTGQMRMKRLFTILSVAIIAMFTLSCNKEKINNLQKQIDEIKSDQIATLNSQVAGISLSIGNLQAVDDELRGYITTLQEQKDALEKADRDLAKSIADLKKELSDDISAAEANALAQLEAYKSSVAAQLESINSVLEALQAKDQDLQRQITSLKNYVENDLKAYISEGDNSVKAWVSASFVTLEQFNATAGIISTIQAQIAAINQQMEQLGGGASGITRTELDAAISTLDESLQEKIGQAVSDCNAALSTAKEEITAAYTTAIQSAIAASESTIKTWVNNQLAGYYTIAQIDAKITALKTNLEGQLTSQKTYLKGLINSLETSLTTKINNNKSLIAGLQNQLNGLSSDLSELAGKVVTNTTNISKNAAAIATNSQNIAANASDIDACEQLIAANAALISANATAISNNAKAISDNAADIVQLRADLATARAEITSAYQQAISKAISTLDGKLSGQIATEIAAVNSRIDTEIATINAAIDAMNARVTQCEKDIKSIKNTIYTMQQDIEDLRGQVAAILARIQSITFVPAYSDGKVPVSYTDNGTLTPGTAVLDFELQPASTASELAQVWQTALKMKAVYTTTKAAPETVQLAITSVSADKGYLSVTISCSALAEDFFRSRCSANAALVISDGNNELASEYVPLVPWTTDVISFGCPNFKAWCVENFDTDGDGEITEDEAKAVTSITASMLNITSLVGIEYFSNLETIDVSFNKLETLDLSHSPKLTSVLVNGNKLQNLSLAGLSALQTLDCSNNKLTALNVSESENLKTLACSGNNIGALNVKKNKALTDLQCSNNQLNSLDLKNNTALETLFCRKNGISVLDVTKLTALKNLDCSNNGLASLNLYQNTLLEALYCGNNSLTSLGVSANTALTLLDCSGDALTALNITKNTALETLNCANNVMTSMDVSRNVALLSVNCKGNMSMTKLWVKNAAQAAALTIQKEDITQIAFNDGGINIPDAKLKSYLLALFDDDEDGEISIVEAENVQNVNCSGRGISDLTGLECCPNLKYLNFSGNNVAIADLPNLTQLETVVAYGNVLTRLNLNNDIALKSLYVIDVNTNALSGTSCVIEGFAQSASLKIGLASTPYTSLTVKNSTALTALDITDNTQLIELIASGNPSVASLDISTLGSLTDLDVNASGLTALDVSRNVELVSLDCSSNALSALNVDNNTALVNLDCADNDLSTLRVTNNILLDKLDCSDNALANINVRKNTVLKTLNVSGNADITALALGYNPILEDLNAANTGLTDIDLSDNLVIKTLNLSGCAGIHGINITANTALVDLNVSGTSITALDVSNMSITSLNVNGLPLESLTIKGALNCLLGQYVVASGIKGVVFYANDVVKILSIDEASKKWGPKGETGANSRTDGATNTNILLSTGRSYDAAKWCRDKGESWYLPAEDEAKEIIKNGSILNDTLSSIGGTQLEEKNDYWTSTERVYRYSGKQYYRAYTVSMRNGSWDYDMTENYHVRAIRAL